MSFLTFDSLPHLMGGVGERLGGGWLPAGVKPRHSPTRCTAGDVHAQILVHFGVEIWKL